MISGRLFDITERLSGVEIDIAERSLFRLTDAGSIDARAALERPGWSLYALDFEAGEALFTHLSDTTDLGNVPFVYAWQQQHAGRLLTVPFAQLDDLALHREKPERCALIFSTGRCGSTLLARALAGLEDTWSLSEPDAFSNIALHHLKLEPKERVRLLRQSLVLTWQPETGQSRLAIKLRSQSSLHLSDYQQAFPHAALIFLWRDMSSWAESMHRFLTRLGLPLDLLDLEFARVVWELVACGHDDSVLDEFADLAGGRCDIAVFLAAAWVTLIEAVRDAWEAGSRPLMMSHAQLTAQPERSMARILAHLGADARQLDTVLSAFAQDSQAGTALARDLPAQSLPDEAFGRLSDLGRSSARIQAGASWLANHTPTA